MKNDIGISIAPWVTLILSLAPVFISGAIWWTHRARLQLDLYNLRFRIYVQTLNFHSELQGWSPSANEKASSSLEDSKELNTALKTFVNEITSAKLLFAEDTEIQKLLKTILEDAFKILGYKRDLAPKLTDPELIISQYEQCFFQPLLQLQKSIIELDKLICPYLEYKQGRFRLLPR
jgi:hypothetical protein